MRFVHIHNWKELDRTCSKCETKKSVKYDFNGKQYCNFCILSVRKDEKDDRQDK